MDVFDFSTPNDCLTYADAYAKTLNQIFRSKILVFKDKIGIIFHHFERFII